MTSWQKRMKLYFLCMVLKAIQFVFYKQGQKTSVMFFE